ncbi:uroporphyrin-3 C-methyltransferase [Ectothiorhodospira mobilis]|uniref:Uroporphyrin-3 C-methyltransferase n=1 Tax=Ectothiorhodospira mobilis TaxID=195064 RepID=A0A1I4R0U7_ECTMO|nr:uroporphyrin-3 C-methyltransferase [Ectothiorhodospira mobilis]
MSRQKSNQRAKGGNKPKATRVTGTGPVNQDKAPVGGGRPVEDALGSAPAQDTAAYNADPKDRDALSGQIGTKPASGASESSSSEKAAAGGSTSNAPAAGAGPSQTPKPEASNPVDNKAETSKTEPAKSGSGSNEPAKGATPPKAAAGSGAGSAKPAAAPKAATSGQGGGGGAGRTPPAGGGSGNGRGGKLPLVVGGVAVVLALGVAMNASSTAKDALQMAEEANDRLSSALKDLSEMQERTAALPEQVNQLERDLRSEVETAIEEARAELQSMNESQARRLETLEQGLASLQNQTDRPEREWKVSEVGYLLRIAQHRMDFMNDAEGAMAALAAADEMLKEMGDPRFGDVRDAIARERQALKAYEGNQVDEIVQALEEVSAELKPLPLKQPDNDQGSQMVALGEPGGDAAWWERAYYQVLNELNEHITVRQHQQVVRSMPDADTELFMRQVLALRIESARLAALRYDQEDYRDNLESARELLVEYFASEPVAPLMKRLEDLQKRELRAEQPDIGKSYELLVQVEG